MNVHAIRIQDQSTKRRPPNPRDEDGLFNYSHSILKRGLLLRDFQDAVKEGDGGRIEYIWKFLMLLFKVCGKTKYALAAIRLYTQLNALLTPREANSLRWNRTINLRGGVGRNVAIDQVMEHNSRETKELMYAHGANLNFSSAQTYSRASNPIKQIICNFDDKIKLKKQSSKHKRRKDEDMNFIRSERSEGSSGEKTPRNRKLPKDPISALAFKNLSLWLTNLG